MKCKIEEIQSKIDVLKLQTNNLQFELIIQWFRFLCNGFVEWIPARGVGE